MGAGCSHPVEFIAYAATSEEVRDAVKSIEAWQKAQEDGRTGKGFQHTADTKSPLLTRVGGTDNVKRVVEGFYRRLYADERFDKFLAGFDMPYLRAKQSTFMSWLFGPPGVPYGGKHLRTVHLKMIKLQGFSPEDFEVGMDYFAEAMKELGAPETIISEVMSKIRPFKEVIFTPNAKDDEEIARWAAEGQAKKAAAAGKPETPVAEADHPPSKPGTAEAPAAAAVAAAAVAADRPSSAASTASARARQCPFSGAMAGALSASRTASRPSSAAVAAAPPPPPVAAPPPAPAAASSRPASSAPAIAAAAPVAAANSRPPSSVPPAPQAPAPAAEAPTAVPALQKEKSQPPLMKATTTELVDAFISEAITADPPAPAPAAGLAAVTEDQEEEEQEPSPAAPAPQAQAEAADAGGALDGLDGLDGLDAFGAELGASAPTAEGATEGAEDEADGARQPPASTLSQALGQLESSEQLGGAVL